MALAHNFIIIPHTEFKELIELQKLYLRSTRIPQYYKPDNLPWPDNSYSDTVDKTLSNIMAYYKMNRAKAIQIHDDLILGNLASFESIHTFAHCFIPCMGLNYYGFTLIPKQSLLEFKKVLEEISYNTEFDLLISLCELAHSVNECVLHCGI